MNTTMSTTTKRSKGSRHLRRLADERGQYALVALLGVSQPCVSHWTLGVYVPSVPNIKLLNERLGIPVTEWFEEEE